MTRVVRRRIWLATCWTTFWLGLVTGICVDIWGKPAAGIRKSTTVKTDTIYKTLKLEK